jgi:hypothetical protein
LSALSWYQALLRLAKEEILLVIAIAIQIINTVIERRNMERICNATEAWWWIVHYRRGVCDRMRTLAWEYRLTWFVVGQTIDLRELASRAVVLHSIQILVLPLATTWVVRVTAKIASVDSVATIDCTKATN